MKRSAAAFWFILVAICVSIGCAVDYTTTVGNNWLITGATIETAAISDSTLDDCTLDGGTVDDIAIGGTTPAAGAFTTVTASSTATVTGDLRESASVFYAVKTKRITIGCAGTVEEDFNFAADADTTEQVIDAGAIGASVCQGDRYSVNQYPSGGIQRRGYHPCRRDRQFIKWQPVCSFSDDLRCKRYFGDGDGWLADCRNQRHGWTCLRCGHAGGQLVNYDGRTMDAVGDVFGQRGDQVKAGKGIIR